MRRLSTIMIVTGLFVSCRQPATNGITNQTSVNDFMKLKKYIAIPLIKNSMGHFTVRAKVNQDTATLILDTGASETCLDENSAKKFGIALERSGHGASGYGGESQNVQVAKVSLALDSFTVRSLDIAVIDLSYVNKAYATEGGARIDGVLGADVLLRHHAIIDYGTGTLFLRK